MKTAKPILLDTNVLVYGQQKKSEFYKRSRKILEQGFKGKLSVCVCPQVLMEFHSTVTNPKRVTGPVSTAESLEQIKKYVASKNILKIYPSEDTLGHALRLIEVYGIGKQDVYDAQLVATMLSNDIDRIYTFNLQDFRKFQEIEALEP